VRKRTEMCWGRDEEAGPTKKIQDAGYHESIRRAYVGNS